MKRSRKNLIALAASVGTALSLALGKSLAFFVSGSLAVLASALDSALDAVVSTVNFFTTRAAEKPADREHGYGHGKFEAFAEFGQGIFLTVSAGIIAFSAVKRFFVPQEISHEIVSIVVMLVSMSATAVLSAFLSRTAKSTGSLIVKSDLAHYFSDILANSAVIVGLLLVKMLGFQWIDSLVGFGIAIVILKTALDLLKESFEVLTDREIDNATRRKIVSILNAAKGKKITGWHLLRTRRVGSQIHIDAHIVFDDHMGLRRAHDIGEEISDEICVVVPHSVVLFHLDPDDDSKKNAEMMLR